MSREVTSAGIILPSAKGRSRESIRRLETDPHCGPSSREDDAEAMHGLRGAGEGGNGGCAKLETPLMERQSTADALAARK